MNTYSAISEENERLKHKINELEDYKRTASQIISIVSTMNISKKDINQKEEEELLNIIANMKIDIENKIKTITNLQSIVSERRSFQKIANDYIDEKHRFNSINSKLLNKEIDESMLSLKKEIEELNKENNKLKEENNILFQLMADSDFLPLLMKTLEDLK